jgi:hypothetical protein
VTQLLYTEKVIVTILLQAEFTRWQERVVRLGVAFFAWTALAFQTAALFLFAQALGLFSEGSMKMARYGVVGGMGLVACVTLLGLLSNKQGQKKLHLRRGHHDDEGK